MRKGVMLLLPFVLALQLPFCPLEYIPREWIRSFEVGMQWTRLFIRVYEASRYAEEEEQQQKGKTVPLTQVQTNLSLHAFAPSVVEHSRLTINHLELTPEMEFQTKSEVVMLHFHRANTVLQISEEEEWCELDSGTHRPETHS